MKPLDSDQDGKIDAKGRRQRLRGRLYKSMRLLSPIAFLVRARNYYVRSMGQCAGMSSYTGDVMASPGMGLGVPRSFSANSSDDDIREIIRAASQRERAAAMTRTRTRTTENSPSFPRSFSTPTDQSRPYQLGVGSIDEESPCYFPASFRKSADEDLFPRSRSYNIVESIQISNFQARKNVKAM